jgi:hypothetical protein
LRLMQIIRDDAGPAAGWALAAVTGFDEEEE